jgi:lipoic acid synthetase
MSEIIEKDNNSVRIKKPKWLRVKLPTGENYRKVRALVAVSYTHLRAHETN